MIFELLMLRLHLWSAYKCPMLRYGLNKWAVSVTAALALFSVPSPYARSADPPGSKGLTYVILRFLRCPAKLYLNRETQASQLRPPVGGQVPPTGRPDIPVAKSVAKSDTSTSIVIKVNGPQIQRGKTEIETHDDIVYSTPSTAGNKPVELKMDILVPNTGGMKPLVVWFPGGGFIYANKRGSLDHRTYVAEAGYVVASVQYRTITNGATCKDGVADAKSAIRYLRAHADQYSIDPGKIAVWGESAGGYIAAMVGTTNGVKQFDVGDNLDQSSDVQAVIDQFGPSDLSRIGADFDPAYQRVLLSLGNSTAQWVYGPGTKKSVSDDPRAIARANPATYVDSSDPPFLLFHGTADKLVSPSQTLLVHNALRAKRVDSTRYVLIGAGHGDMSFMGDAMAGYAWSTQKVMGIIVTFLGKHLKR
jgi:acetyl esterase/lipase